ncbi:uncharacterized protein LOC119719841 [Patiria miniata]|uniref:Uncharacterized protein n=1 Tax=Patiria miniata TaxID=46514 RepID=A0A913Z3I0_PATMI|nr:uncharacterized protein LOC119719841 [Patiria miniata]
MSTRAIYKSGVNAPQRIKQKSSSFTQVGCITERASVRSRLHTGLRRLACSSRTRFIAQKARKIASTFSSDKGGIVPVTKVVTMRPHVLLFTCLAVPCLLLAQMVSSVPIFDGDNQLRALDIGDWPVDAYGDTQYLHGAEKRVRPRGGEYCVDWIHNTWRRCKGRKG